jgi:phosphatidate cytidylyltransferase
MATDDEREGLEHTGYRTGQVRIVGAEPAGRSAAIRDEEPADAGDDAADEQAPPPTFVPPLPHWTEPATGEVPSILGRDGESTEADRFATMPGPTWRQEGSDWEAQDEEFEPSMLAGDQTGQGSLDTGPSDRQPWVFDLPGSTPEPSEIFGDKEGWADDAESEWEELALGASPPSWASDDDGPITAVTPAVGPEPAGDELPELTGVASSPLGDSEFDDVPLAIGDDPFVIDDIDIEEPKSRFRSLRPSERRAAAPARERRPEPPARPAPTAPRLRPPTPAGAKADEAPPRNVAAAIVSGLVLGAVALITFKVGPVAAVALVTVVVTMAAAEAFAAFRQGGYHPVTLLGLVATVSLMVATYNKGQVALPLVFVLLLVACFVWHLAGVEQTDAVRSTGTTLFIFGWVAVFGSFGALLLSPALFPERHGIAFLLGGIIAGVAYDVGALTFGAWLGRHPMAAVSPNKTWEGFVGGLISSVFLSVVIVHMIHPWTVGKAAVLGLVVSVVATLGDLFESTIKRHLGRKDMGRLLPGHGGLLDRVDGLLFVLPATYYLVIAFHLG